MCAYIVSLLVKDQQLEFLKDLVFMHWGLSQPSFHVGQEFM